MSHVSNYIRTTFTKGFTLVELMLAMSFVSVLLLAISLTIIQVSTAYNRGMTLKETNQAARSITEDVRYSLSDSQNFNLETDILSVKSGSIDAGGRLCLGNYSYIWNYGRVAAFADRTMFSKAPLGGSPEVHLVKLNDVAKAYCAKNSDGSGPLLQNISSGDELTARELLRVGDRSLSLSKFSITADPSATDNLTGQRLYNFEFVITSGGVESMNTDQSACLPPENANADLTYCSVQRFTLAIRAGSGVN